MTNDEYLKKMVRGNHLFEKAIAFEFETDNGILVVTQNDYEQTMLLADEGVKSITISDVVMEIIRRKIPLGKDYLSNHVKAIYGGELVRLIDMGHNPVQYIDVRGEHVT